MHPRMVEGQVSALALSRIAELGQAMSDTELIQQEIEADSSRPGVANVRLKRSGAHVWAVVAYYLEAGERDVQAVATDYGLSLDEVRAALAFYDAHREVIDSRIADNEMVLAG